MELLIYDLHINTKKLKVKNFVFDLNFNICVIVRILIPHMLHDAVHKALIVEEYLNDEGQRSTPSRHNQHVD
jgi:hypothetical protein